jgi:CrcB protein
VRRRHADVVAVVALGGAIGALARWFVEEEWTARPDGFPFAAFAINVVGSLALGALVVVLTAVHPGHRYARPFLAVGVLGGFTTFSTFAVESRTLLASHPAVGFAYLVATPVAAVTAALLGAALASSTFRTRPTSQTVRRES